MAKAAGSKKAAKKAAAKKGAVGSKPAKSASAMLRPVEGEPIKSNTRKRPYQTVFHKPLTSITGSQLVGRPATIPEEQWNLPAGFKPDGSIATLAEVVSKPVATFVLGLNKVGSNKDLVVERIKRQTNYPVRHMLGFGEVDKERAIAEVKAGTEAGKYIEESERRAIKIMTERALKAIGNGQNRMH